MTTTVARVHSGPENPHELDSLEAAIQQLINLGEKDPLGIARKIEQRHDAEWLSEQLYALREEIIAHYARQRINGQRRSAMSGLRKGASPSSLMNVGEWIPNVGWKKLAEWTESDLRSRENYYLKMSGTAKRLAAWCHECIDLMKAEGVQKLGKVKAPLPVLDEMELVAVVNGDPV